jgi:site-specific DNA-methyltransferase (adenine-specific)
MNKTEHKLYADDALQELLNISDATIQLIVTSPPYWNVRNYNHSKQIGFHDKYVGYLTKMEKILKECVRVLLPDGKIALNIGNIYNYESNEKRVYTVNLMLDLWKILDNCDETRFMGTIYWKKTTSRKGAVLFGSYPFPSNFMISTALEAIHIFRKKGKRKVSKEIKKKSWISKSEFRKFREPIWCINGVSKKKHPAVFPDGLPYRLIKMYSFYGDIVLDPFCGIGTTNVESLKLGRNSIGIDISKDYIYIANSNLKKIDKDASIMIYNQEHNNSDRQ